MIRATKLFLLSLFALSASLLNSCQQTCDNIPTQQAASVRIINAVPDVPALKVYIDGKFFDSAYYDITRYPKVTGPFPEDAFGYRTTYHSDRSPVIVGRHRIVALSDLTVADTIADTTILLTDRRQSLVFMGKHRPQGGISQPVKFRYLNDDARAADPNKTLARFVQGVSDLRSIDVYFSKNIKRNSTGSPAPDLTINYGEVSDQNGTGTGTGTLATDYLEIPIANNDGLRITAKGDTNNTLLIITTPFSHAGFFATVIIRGETQPIGDAPLLSSLVLEDGSESQGTFNFSTESFAVRLVNATHDVTKLSVFPMGFNDHGSFRTDVPLQEYVKDLPLDSVSRYWPLTPYYHGDAQFIFSRGQDIAKDTIFRFHHSSIKDMRYSFIAIDSAKFGQPARYGALILTDTVPLESGNTASRVRFVNTSADHVMNFTLNGTTYSLKQGDVSFAILNAGVISFTVSDGAKSSAIQFTLAGGESATLYFMPANASQEFPVTIARN